MGISTKVSEWLRETKNLGLQFGDELKEEWQPAAHWAMVQGWFACYAQTHGVHAAKVLYSDLFNVTFEQVHLSAIE